MHERGGQPAAFAHHTSTVPRVSLRATDVSWVRWAQRSNVSTGGIMAPARRRKRCKKKEREREKKRGIGKGKRNLVTITKAVVARPIYCPSTRDSSLFKYFPKPLSEIFHFLPNVSRPFRESGQSSWSGKMILFAVQSKLVRMIFMNGDEILQSFRDSLYYREKKLKREKKIIFLFLSNLFPNYPIPYRPPPGEKESSSNSRKIRQFQSTSPRNKGRIKLPSWSTNWNVRRMNGPGPVDNLGPALALGE